MRLADWRLIYQHGLLRKKFPVRRMCQTHSRKNAPDIQWDEAKMLRTCMKGTKTCARGKKFVDLQKNSRKNRPLLRRFEPRTQCFDARGRNCWTKSPSFELMNCTQITSFHTRLQVEHDKIDSSKHESPWSQTGRKDVRIGWVGGKRLCVSESVRGVAQAPW